MSIKQYIGNIRHERLEVGSMIAYAMFLIIVAITGLTIAFLSIFPTWGFILADLVMAVYIGVAIYFTK